MPAKQVLIWRKDLKVRTGKVAAQISHASVGALLRGKELDFTDAEDGEFCMVVKMIPPMKEWLAGHFTKICVYVESEQELLDIYKKAEEAGIQCRALITDRGLTEFHGVPTNTCVGLGPEDSEVLDKITGHLPLF